MDTTDNNIQVTLNLKCEKITGEDNKASGKITMTGTAQLGRMNLAFQVLMANNVSWKEEIDPAHTKLQSQNLSIPLTQLDMTTREGLHKITFYNNVRRWEPMVKITKAMDKIKRDRRLQDVNINPNFP